MARVAVAMSGGVDSAVAAALLVGEGHDVVGITMNLWPTWVPRTAEGSGCCGIGAIDDARAAARALGIRHYVLNLREEFEREVIGYFTAEYARGRTPNPCIACNKAIKFDLLLHRTRSLGMDDLATGHYARTDRGPDGRVRLLRAVDRHKDQSYVLAGLTQSQLVHVRFPVGTYTKPRVREIARGLGLGVAEKPDSQEICFVPGGDYAAVVGRFEPQALRPGPIYDLEGQRLGEHRGVARYTVGQRRGLGLAGDSAWYVVRIDPDRNAVIVGDAGAVRCPELLAGDINWVALPGLAAPRAATVRIRHASADLPAVIAPALGGAVAVRFETWPRAAAPGQAIAFYDGDVVLGGGVIHDVEIGGTPVGERSPAGRAAVLSGVGCGNHTVGEGGDGCPPSPP
ncbi:MAG TPA: tRNA 2-thiouridine(34) synthase MnmA [bacterium]|nr:tRNA 2-thiouridine(34) synthase MnmA [bacterium]